MHFCQKATLTAKNIFMQGISNGQTGAFITPVTWLYSHKHLCS
jgi:hypothetical protein